MWVRFIREFWWEPPERKGRVTLRYAEGAVLFVRRACAAEALAKGAAERASRPSKD